MAIRMEELVSECTPTITGKKNSGSHRVNFYNTLQH